MLNRRFQRLGDLACGTMVVVETRHKIERPFLVMAMQKPIESEGTYNLPEAQLD